MRISNSKTSFNRLLTPLEKIETRIYGEEVADEKKAKELFDYSKRFVDLLYLID